MGFPLERMVRLAVMGRRVYSRFPIQLFGDAVDYRLSSGSTL